jgi:hypothetical protein
VLPGAEWVLDRGATERARRADPAAAEVWRQRDLVLTFAAPGGRLVGDTTAYRRMDARSVLRGTATVRQADDTLTVTTALTPDATAGVEPPPEAIGQYTIRLQREGADWAGSVSGESNGRPVEGPARARTYTVTPETPRDWNLIGLHPGAEGIHATRNVGVVWVHLVGGVIWFGPDIEWGETWQTAGSWKSEYAFGAWAHRVPDGTHPWDPFVGGRQSMRGTGSGRLAMGCVLEDACVLNASVSMGRPDDKSGFGTNGYHMAKFGARIGAYGARVFVANNALPRSRGRNFKYVLPTRNTFPMGKGGREIGIKPPRPSVVLFDYNRTMGIDVNKDMLGNTKASPTGEGTEGYFAEGVVVRDNLVYNNGHKGFNISGRWVTIANNRNERWFLERAWDPEWLGGWELTLDGHLESSPGGLGIISDNLSRAFDLSGKSLWIHRNAYNNLGSNPGNDGEGILCQAHGGSHLYGWAVTYNTHEKGTGHTSYIGGWNVRMAGALFGWNAIPGSVGVLGPAADQLVDIAFAGNRSEELKAPATAYRAEGEFAPTPPADVTAEPYADDAIRVAWADRSDNEVGFRVERSLDGGAWAAIAYRPPRIQGHSENPQEWVDFTAPRGRELRYRVLALDAADRDVAASAPTKTLALLPAR